MSNRNKLLITFDELKSNSRIDGNIDNEVLRPIVLLAQEISMQNLIGESMFEFLLSARTTNGIYTSAVTGNTVWTLFVEDYMKPCMYAYCVMEFMDSNAVHLSEQGITQTKGTETSERTEQEEMEYQRSQSKIKANFYANRLRKMICDDRYWPTFQDYFGNIQQNLYPDQRINKGGQWYPRAGTQWSNFRRYDL